MSAERLSVFPAFHKVAGRIVLVVGDGGEAEAKVRLLLETEATIRLVSADPAPGLAALAAERGIELRRRDFLAADFDGAVLVFAASGGHERDAAVVAAARARNIPANAVDLPDLCDFYTPALVNRAPVAVAITSTGTGPVLAQKLRARIEAMLPARLGLLARLGDSFRAAAEKVLPKGQPRRRFWSDFFDGSVAETVLAGRLGEARRLASRLLTEADAESRGFVSLVGAGPGAADLLTLRAHRILQEADVIIHDGAISDATIALGRRDAARIRVGLRATQRVTDVLIREAASGRRVVRLVEGDPGHAAEEAAALAAAGISFEIVPGVAAGPRQVARAEAA